MEAIPKEVIDMAEDFFSHQSQEEKDKMLNEYFKEQKYIAAQCLVWMKTITDKNCFENIKMLYLVIYRSYKYYGIKLPVISIDTFRTTYDKYLEDNNIHGDKGLNALDILVEITKGSHQDELINHIILKLHGTDDNLVEYKTLTDGGTSIAIASILLLLLNNEMQIQLRNEIN
jgi:hypothetical protein